MTTLTKKDVANEIYKNYNYSASVDFIKKHAENRKKLLDVNCSDGTLLSLLEKEGFDVCGITPKKKQALQAKEKTNLPIYKKSILKFKSKEKYEIITSLYSACNKYKNYLGIDIALNKMNKCLAENGIIILQLLKTAKPQKIEENEENLENSIIKKKKEKIKIINTYKIQDKQFKFKNKYKIFDVEKILNIAKKNGLKVVDVFRDYSTKTPNTYGDNFQIILAKNDEETPKEAKKRKRQFVTKKGKVKVLSKKIYFTTMILMACSGVFVGTLIGDFYNSNFANAVSFDFSEEQVSKALAQDSDAISKIDQSKAPTSYNSAIVFMYAEQNSLNKSFVVNESGALQVMGVNQTVANLTTITPTKRTKIAASISSLVSLATKTVYEKNGDSESVSQYSGKPTDLNSTEEGSEFGTDWGSPKNLTVKEYRDEWGVVPAWICPYVVCSQTVAESSAFSRTTNENGEDIYTATIKLKTKYNSSAKDEFSLMAYTYYVKQISAMSGVTVTDFEYCNITFSIDKDYNLRTISIDETYNVRYGMIPVTCPSKLNQIYTYIKGD
ncbi:MAG: methyltransferase domain-containing protein [Clostridia bacterium]|nr:methyltransferase domain-containing protein [Clostridia bacterium]